MVFVDSDLIIQSLRKSDSTFSVKAKQILKELSQNQPTIKITIFNYAELIKGTYWAPNVAKSQRIIKGYLKNFEIVDFTLENAIEFARISAELEIKGQRIGDMDILIASIVIGSEDILYTKNIEHFKRISNLAIKNWE
ncbi:MAG TPA: type II toxin-antitoxin system VapC family toxin [Candidatus Deferrimicrobium sp.]|nr:type II toxin-antitoxin system VapC family toxin [Candidatus Deferrimicrobium sp.]